MSKKIRLIILVALALSLTACVRPASTPAPQAGAANGNLPVALGTPTGMAGLELLGTQTAQALSGTPAATTPADAAATMTPVGQAPAVDTPMPTPVPAVVVPQATVETTKPGTYALKEGEFPYCIARRFNVDPDQLLSLNGLSNGQTFYAGLTLKIPTTGSPFSGGSRAIKAHPAQYTVRAGDTVYSVACLFGDVDPVNIAAVNGLAAPYKLTVGAQIQIP